jgi:arabinogalactan endo-1,4-beta-galactosidase
VNGRGDNLLLNGDFESGDLTGWELTEYGKADELGVEKNAANARSGKHGFHFWSEKQNSVCFRLEQTVRDVEHGKFTFRISIMGGDGGDAEIYAYLTINGEQVGVIPMKMTNYGSWYTAEMSWYNSENISEMTVGIYVCCPGEGNGAWGSIDDAELLRID